MTKKKTEPQSNNFYIIVYIYFLIKKGGMAERNCWKRSQSRNCERVFGIKNFFMLHTTYIYYGVFMLWLQFVSLCVVYKNLLGCWLGFWYFFFALLTQIFHSSNGMSKQMWVMLGRFVECSDFFGGKSKLNLAISKITNTFHSSGDPFTLCYSDLRLINSWYM